MDELPHSRNLRFVLIADILFLVLLTTCLPPAAGTPRLTNPWANALRALDPVDASSPSNDITAVYLRPNGDDLQIRIDLLDFQAPGQLSLDIMIGDDSAPKAAPLDIHIPPETNSARISFDPLLATVIVDVPLTEIPARPRVDVATPEDQITGLTLDSPIPTQTAPLLLTFYDAFTGRFPAEALRSWDGAHSGPRGERHGLKHLLDAVEEYQVPVVLLDLKEPESLSALDAMGILPQIDALANNGLLILPESEQMLPTEKNQGIDDFQFVHLQDSTHLNHPLFSKITYIPIVIETDATQPTPNGPSLEVRRALVETALNGDEKDLLVLGGSLQSSTWGNPDRVSATLAYFASRPYIHVLDAEALLEFPTRFNNAIIPQHIGEATLQTQSILEYAKSWAKTSSTNPIYHCQSNQSDESHPDCVMVNEAYLAIFDAKDASLTFLFTRDETGLHQLIGPSWQVAPGIDIYPGAFADDKDYQPAINENTLTFKSTDSTRTKTFSLIVTGLEVEYQTQKPVTTQIPLLVDPWTRFTPGWAEKYTQQNSPSGIRWGLENGPMVSVQTEGRITMRVFNESLSLLNSPEDPDFDYPAGHYIPFPMAIAEVEMQDGYFLRLERLP